MTADDDYAEDLRDWYAEDDGNDPIPLTANPVDVPPFPVDALPEAFADKVAELAEATQTDPAMAATSALTTLSACIGGHAKIQVRSGWTEPLCLHTVTVADPAERKSAVQESMVAPLHDTETAFAQDIELLQRRDELEMAKKTLDRLNKDAVNAAAKAAGPGATEADRQAARKAAQAAKDAKAALQNDDDRPVIPRLLADDVTPEATASLLADNGGRIAIVSTEGGIFDTIAGRYARTVNLDVYLKGHSGDRIRVDRQGRDPQHIPSPALTMGLMVQPRIIEAIGANRDFVGRGLLARILYATPVSKVGRRVIGAKPVTAETEYIYRNTVMQLASDMTGWQGDPAVLVLDPASEAEVRRIEEKIEPTLAGDGELASPTLRAWGGKYVGAVVRIAGLLHFAKFGEKGHKLPVQVDTVRDAERIGQYFKASAINVFTTMADPNVADAIYLLRRIVRLECDEVSERDMHHASQRRFPTKVDMMPALRRLVDHGWLIPLETPKPTGGRPAAPVYRVHTNTKATEATEGLL
jgi:replicative DNA helicase